MIMKNSKWILALLTMATVSLYAQVQPAQTNTQTDNAQQQNDRQQNGITRPGQSTGRQDSDAQDSQGDAAATADTPGAAEAAADANNGAESGEGSEREVNTPAVTQSTESQSGSPAVPSENDGRKRDGTNSVQRASMNMVGSPANNIRLKQDRPSNDPNNEMRDRQVYEQDKSRSARNEETSSGTTSSGGDANEINNKTRRENNADSDQSLSSQEKANDKRTSRAERRAKRKKG
jgi:hypothetical protein